MEKLRIKAIYKEKYGKLPMYTLKDEQWWASEHYVKFLEEYIEDYKDKSYLIEDV